MTGSGQEGGGNCIWGTPPDPRPFGFAQGKLRGFAPSRLAIARGKISSGATILDVESGPFH
ncbi:MAG: hypothetical protein HYX93_01675 [Chloroflexi bacterium]|nr:hypothetical protein [Chloroflexota bacterium]